MQNIMFTEPNPAKILAGEKTLTARNWKRKPPKIRELMTASTGYKKETRFAIIRVLNVWEWDGDLDGIYAETVTGLSKEEIAKREGYTHWDDFIMAYYEINANNFLDDSRKDYFIQFEVAQRLKLGAKSILDVEVRHLPLLFRKG